MSEKRTCPNCKGKGHVIDSVTLLHPMFWLFAIAEKNDKNGVTRQKCPHCKGNGWIVW